MAAVDANQVVNPMAGLNLGSDLVEAQYAYHVTNVKEQV